MDQNMELERLLRENTALRAELAKKKKKNPWTCLVIGIVGVIGAFFGLAILAAVALPMYATFKQKARVAEVLHELKPVRRSLIYLYEKEGSFASVKLDSDSSVLTSSQGTFALPTADGMVWAVDGGIHEMKLRFDWLPGSGCPSEACDGVYTLTCSPDTKDCLVGIKIGDGRLDLDL